MLIDEPDLAQFTLLLDRFISHWEKKLNQSSSNTSLTTTKIDQVTKKLTFHAEHT